MGGSAGALAPTFLFESQSSFFSAVWERQAGQWLGGDESEVPMGSWGWPESLQD